MMCNFLTSTYENFYSTEPQNYKVADEVSGDQDVPGEAPPAGPHQPGGLAEPAVQGPG